MRPVSPTGDPDYEEEIDWPILWQPIKPKDFSVSSEIFTGSMTKDNSISIFFRKLETNKTLMGDFDYMTMEEIDGIRPDVYEFGDRLSPGEDLYPGSDIYPGPGSEASLRTYYLYSRILWNSVTSKLIIGDAIGGDLYVFDDIDLSPNTRYLVTWYVEGESIRVRIDELQLGYIQVEVYDTGVIYDTRIQRDQGEFGWFAQIEDGDSLVENIRQRSASFGNLITKEYLSSTPVVGVQLFESSTPPAELLTGVGSGPFGGIVTSQKDDSFKIDTKGMMKGASTNSFVITNWSNTTIEFDIQRPEGHTLAYLYGDSGNIISIPIPDGIPGQWQKVRKRMTDRPDQTGRYQLVILKVASINSETWYLKNLSVRSRSVGWSARGKDDPWNMAGDQWIDFHDSTNASNSGILLKEPGRGLQVQAEMLVSDGSIYEFKSLPKYAEPGRFIWDQVEPDPPAHSLSIVADVNGLTVDFAASLTLNETDERVPISYVWYFGTQGSLIGRSVRKTFPSPGIYTATLRVSYADGTVQTPNTWTQRLSA